MAGRTARKRDRLPGWPPERADHHLRRIPSDELTLAILWALVAAGLIALVALAVLGLLVAGPSVHAAYAAGAGGDQAAQSPPDPQYRPESQAVSLSDARAVDVSGRSGVKAGTLLESTFDSQILGRSLPYRIYLPPGYSKTLQRYPAVYLLHGGGADFREWTDKNHLGPVADALMATRAITPMVIVMPEGDHSYFINQASSGPRWADYITEELVPYIDANFRTLPDRGHRAIGGLSMGGEGALQIAFNHPDLFSIVGADSPSLHPNMENAPDFFGNWENYSQYDPLWLAATRKELDSLQIWIDVGNQDGELKAASQLHAILTARGIDHQWEVNPGGHDNNYWGPHVPDYLGFYSNAFARNDSSPIASVASLAPGR